MMILGLFPPSSSVTLFKLDLLAASITLRPVRVLPVKAIWSTRQHEVATPTDRSYLLDLGMLCKGLADFGTSAVDDIDDTRRDSSLLCDLSEEQSGEGSEFGGLEDDCVSTSQGRGNLPSQQHDCVLRSERQHKRRNIVEDSPGKFHATICATQPIGSWRVYDSLSSDVSMTLPEILSAHPA